MTLPDDYLSYPKRRPGQDMGRHDWQIAEDRSRIKWLGDKKIAIMIVIPCEFYPLNPTNKPFAHPRGMKTPYPDLRHYTTRDYGNRIGVYRLLDVLAENGLRATFPVSAAMLAKAPPLLDAILRGGHEVAAAGLHSSAIHWGGISPGEEERLVAETRAAFGAIDQNPATWMSPVRNQSRETLDLLAAHGFTRCLDWETDQIPLAARTGSGPVLTLPVHNELEDAKLILDYRQSEDIWADQVLEAARFLKMEADGFGAQMLGFQVTPFVMGQPFRVHAFRRLAEDLASDKTVWCTSAKEIADAVDGQRKARLTGSAETPPASSRRPTA